MTISTPTKADPPEYAGIIRQARRPTGWRPPGPRPAGPCGDASLYPGEGEDLCFLSGEWRILQRMKGHRWSLDDLITAWYALETVGDRDIRRHLDLGCGIGSVLMMGHWRMLTTRGLGLEAQELSAGMARRSIAYNGIADLVEVRHGDIRDPELVPEGAVFDLVTGTPPYFKLGTANVSDKEQCGPCRHEFLGGVEDYCFAAARLMAPGGRFVVCEDARQNARVEAAAMDARLAICSRRDIIPREGLAPLISVYSMAHHSDLACPCGQRPQKVEAPLTVRDRSGKRTAEFGRVRTAMGMPP